ncbi:hypothetical protein HHI36_004727 [Cryptolaemus montrouzieri]|uniref:Uncharacterized protein n=1 Tax=Cryptolaemus montrouzieri TaxID=559131 RepID=A0ABD2NS74_9CUCU
MKNNCERMKKSIFFHHELTIVKSILEMKIVAFSTVERVVGNIIPGTSQFGVCKFIIRIIFQRINSKQLHMCLKIGTNQTIQANISEIILRGKEEVFLYLMDIVNTEDEKDVLEKINRKYSKTSETKAVTTSIEISCCDF